MANHPELYREGGLPAEDFRLVGNNFMIQTPTDDRGLVEIAEHIKLVKMTLSPGINWNYQSSNIHHFYWPAHLYNKANDNVQTQEIIFRNLPIHKGLLPIQFHNWMHRISEPPILPKPEVIEYRNESWFVANKLFQAVRKYKRQDRSLRKVYLEVSKNPELADSDEIEIEILTDLYENFFSRYEKLHKELFNIPKEFRLVDPDKPFDQLNKDLGRVAGCNALILKRQVAV